MSLRFRARVTPSPANGVSLPEGTRHRSLSAAGHFSLNATISYRLLRLRPDDKSSSLLDSSLRDDGRRVDQMLGDEPHLQLIRPQHVRDEDVVRRVVAHLARTFGGFPRLFNDQFVRLEQA